MDTMIETLTPYSLKGKKALITGAASGIGAEVAKTFVSLGAQVAVADIDTDGLTKATAELADGAAAKQFTCDLAEPFECAALVEAAVNYLGHLDILVNSAALYRKVLNEDVDKSYFDQMTDVNMAGTFFLAQASAQHMKLRRSGRIILFTSVAAHRGGVNGSSVYAMTKAAVVSLTKTLARDLAPTGICVNAIAPGGVDTPMLRGQMTDQDLEAFVNTIPIGRLATTQEVALVTAFAASEASAYITGHTFDVNGGQHMR